MRNINSEETKRLFLEVCSHIAVSLELSGYPGLDDYFCSLTQDIASIA